MKYVLSLVMVLFLMGCQTRSTVPSDSPPKVTVNCQQPKTEDPREAPASSLKKWVEQGPAWAVDVLDLLTRERKYRALENACYEEQL